MEHEEPWGQLVSLTDFESQPILLLKNIFQIGRALDCDISLPDNKLVSGHHCKIERNEDTRVVTLFDSSTNGTLLNLEYKLTKGKKKVLKHGDEFYVVYKKENEELNVGYIYQDTEELSNEEGTQEYSNSDFMDATLEDSDCNNWSPVKGTNKRRLSADSESGIDDNAGSGKKAKLQTEEPKIDTGKGTNKTVGSSHTGSDTADAAPSGAAPSGESHDNEEPESGTKPGKLNKEKSIKLSKKKSATETKQDKVEEKSDECKATSDPTSTAVKSSMASSKPAIPERDDIEENLQCMICQEIMHDCISLQPCLHSFCAGCYSDWMVRSQECPTCRKTVERINKNHIVNNLIEAYLKEHPGKKRPAEDIEELNKKNKITNDMLYPVDQKKYVESDSEYSDTSGDGDDNDDDPIPHAFPAHQIFAPPPPQQLFGFGTPVFGINRAFRTVCRQCPDYKDPTGTDANPATGIIGGIKTALNTINDLVTGETTAKTDTEASTSGETTAPSASGADGKPYKDDPKEMPMAPDHRCVPNANHVLCSCCLQPMPDFRLNWPFNTEKTPQQCGMCYRAFCHSYWGCRKQDCLGCLNKFKDMNFGRKALLGLILENQYESDIFRDYIDGKGLSVKDILQECCKQMAAGKFVVQAQGTHHRFTEDTPVCYGCGINQFKQLAFQYRKTIKKEDLPVWARNRADCYWGFKCRTQRNKPHHAKNFNHVCEQTRQY